MEIIHELPAKFRENWISALESGEYKQTTRDFQYYTPYTDCYCATGVGAKANGYDFTPDGEAIKCEVSDAGFQALLTRKLWWIVVDMNDRDKKSFIEIAAWLRENTVGI